MKETLYNYNNKLIPLKELLKLAVLVDIVEVPKYKYNRVKYNQMDYKEQTVYEAKLKETKKEYRIYILKNSDNEVFYTITKKEFNSIKKNVDLDSLFSFNNTEIRYHID